MVFKICAQTGKHTDTYISQYFAPAVIMSILPISRDAKNE